MRRRGFSVRLGLSIEAFGANLFIVSGDAEFAIGMSDFSGSAFFAKMEAGGLAGLCLGLKGDSALGDGAAIFSVIKCHGNGPPEVRQEGEEDEDGEAERTQRRKKKEHC